MIRLHLSLLTFALIAAHSVRAERTLLSDLDLAGIRQGFGQPQSDAAVIGGALVVAGQYFEHAAHMPPLPGRCRLMDARGNSPASRA